jgi:hypothetical protein
VRLGVVLFVDTLNNYAQPEIPIAAVELLETAGYRIILAPVTDDGRAYISKGLVKKPGEPPERSQPPWPPTPRKGCPSSAWSRAPC